MYTLTTSQAAQLLGIEHSHVCDLLDHGRLQTRHSNQRRLVDLDSVFSFLADSTRRS